MLELNPNSRVISDPEHIRRLVLAGNATFTLRSLKTDEHYTYRVRGGPHTKVPNEADFFYVDYCPQYKDHQYIGVLKQSPFGLEFKRTYASRLERDATPLLAIQWFSHLILRNAKSHPQLEFRHEGMCAKCGRPLTDPQSIDRGIGPDCLEKMQ